MSDFFGLRKMVGNIKKRMKAGASGRKKSMDRAIDKQSKGTKVPGSTLGNPGGKVKPISMRKKPRRKRTTYA